MQHHGTDSAVPDRHGWPLHLLVVVADLARIKSATVQQWSTATVVASNAQQ